MLEELAPRPAPREPGEEPPHQPPVDSDPPPPSEPFDWLAPLHNRLIIAGVSTLILLALTAVVLLVFSQGDGGPGSGARVGIVGDDATTPTPVENLTAIALTTTTLRNGPGASFSPLGTVPRGTRVPIIGRNADDTWLQVLYPPGSTIQGWIDISFLDVTGDLIGVNIAGPGSGPSIVVPTQLPTFVFEEPTDTPIPADEPTDTPEFTSTPLEKETPPPNETPVSTATQKAPPEETQASPPTETSAEVPATAVPTTGNPQASANRLTSPATLGRRSGLSMLPSDVTYQVTRRYKERAV